MKDQDQPQAESVDNPIDAMAELLMAGEGGLTDAPADDDEVRDDVDTEGSDEEQPEVEAGADQDESLAQMLGLTDDQLTVDDDGNVQVQIKIDGKTETVSLKDAVQGFQFNKANTQKAQALAEQRKLVEQEKAEFAQVANERISMLDGMAQAMQAQINAEFRSVDWEQLRQIDPAEFTAKRLEFQDRQQQIGQIIAGYQQQAQQFQQEQQAEQAAQMKAFLSEQREKMLENNPSWRNTETFAREMGEMRDFVTKTYGFSEKDLESVRDARLVEMIKDAQAYRKGAQVAEKKRTAPPKLQRAANGQFRPKSQSRLDKLVNAAKVARTKKSPHRRQLETEAITELLLHG
jgi:hypothetical protein